MKKVNINTILLIASILFSAGVYTTKIRGNSEEIQKVKQEYVRKDLFEVHLKSIDGRLKQVVYELRKLNGEK